LALPRWAIGARAFAEAMNVAKLVMSNTSPDISNPNSVIARAATRRWISTRSSSPTASMASQKRRWSSAAAASPGSSLGPAVVCHQSANASLEQGATTRFSVANAR
jgi:hypothetical protein